MPLPWSLKLTSIDWRPVVGLLIAGLLGWLSAWFFLPGGAGTPPASHQDAPARAQPVDAMAKGADLAADAPRSVQSLEQLLQRQEKISQDASRSTGVAPGSASKSSVPGGSAAKPFGKPDVPSAADAARAARMKQLYEIQAKALADLQAVPPGDTKQMMAAMERFEAQMRAAGVPSFIDLDSLRKTLERSSRIQELSKQLTGEAEKGRNADVAKVRALSQELQTVQTAAPPRIIKAEALQQYLAR